MKSLRTGTLGVALLALGAGGAVAQGVAGRGSIKDAPYAAPTFVWSGLYVGGAVGYGVGSSEFSGGVNFFDINLRGAQGIGTIGYDFRLSPGWVLGLFADYAFGDVEGKAALDSAAIERQWAVGGRLGALATPSTLLYASAGYTAADFKFVFDGPERKGNLDGFFVGLGVEQAFSRHLSLKLDYRFSDYGNFDPGPDFGPGAKYENEVHSVRLGVNYHFGK